MNRPRTIWCWSRTTASGWRPISIPVVFLTASSDDDATRRAREAEPQGYILKPFRASDLRTGIELTVSALLGV